MPKQTTLAKNWSRQDWIVLTKIGVTVVVLTMAATIIMSRTYPDDYVKWAFGAVGLVFGYWCK
jgi:uncharacterized membrane protein